MQPWIQLGLTLLGTPSVRYAHPSFGCDPSGFTCSGFVYYLLVQNGFLPAEVPVHTNELFDRFGVLVHEGLQKTGDLVFFSRCGTRPTHVGFYVARQDITSFLAAHPLAPRDNSPHLVLESPGVSGESVGLYPLLTESLNSVDHQLYTQNPIGYKRPAHLRGRYHCFV